MIIFVDESGIHKITDHSTFALAYVSFVKYQDAEIKVKRIEKKLKIDYFQKINLVIENTKTSV